MFAHEGHAQQTASAVLQHFRHASGGDSWSHFVECDSVGTVSFAGKTGAVRYAENLRNGANRAAIQIPGLGVRQADGDSPDQSWHQDEAGDVALASANTPDDVDDRYLTSRAYWRPRFGGATVTVLPAEAAGDETYDRLRFQVPGGHGFTLWIDRRTGLPDRVEGSISKRLSDYHRVDGVMLPFTERKPAGGGELVVTYTSRALRTRLDPDAFVIPFRTDYEMAASGEVTVPAKDGLLFEVKINGKGPFQCLFDTGSVNLMSGTLAKELGLKLDAGSQHIATSSPATLEARKAHVDAVQVGALTVRNQTFEVTMFPDDGAEAVLGYAMLRRFAVKVDYRHQRLTFYDARHFHYAGPGDAVPIHIEGTNFLADATIGSASGRFLLDTGNEFGFTVNPGLVQKNDLVRSLGAHYLGYNGRGYAGPSPEAYLARVDTLRLGSVVAPSVVAHLSTGASSPGELAGNIGQSVLDRFTDVFDCMRGKLYLEKTPDSGKGEVFNRAGLILDTSPRGLVIMTVLPGSPGAKAGLQVGDTITRINGEPPPDSVKPQAFLQAAGTRLSLDVKRGAETKKFSITLRNIV